MNEGEVVVTDSELELTHCLDEWGRLDITNSTSELTPRLATPRLHPTKINNPHLYDANVWFLSRLVNRDLRDPLDPVLYSIGQMGNDLNSFSKVVALPLSQE